MAGRKAVVLSSGGLDSSVCLGIARERSYQIYALSFDYSQRHRLELSAANAQARAFGAVRHVTIPLDLTQFGGSALTAEIDVPKDMDSRLDTGEIPITYVPARNTVFLSVALAWAEVIRADAIMIGVNAVDYSGYPDCRPEFIAAFERLAQLATRGGVEGGWGLEIETPLIDLSKAEIVRRGVEVGVDFSATWSCYDPQPSAHEHPVFGAWRPCGECDSCRLRQAGFAAAGVADNFAG